MAEKSNQPVDRSIRDFLVARRADQFSFLSTIVRVDSQNPPGDTTELAERISDLLANLGLEIDRLPVDDALLAAHDRAPYHNLGVRVQFGEQPELGPHLQLSVHADTPPSGGGWTHDPLGAEIADGKIHGRGVSDGKGDLAAYVYALIALRECAADLCGRVDINITFDGATGGDMGVRHLLASGRALPDFAIVPGAARAAGTTATGVLDLDVEVRGVAAPAGVPQTGADAIEGAAAIMAALYRHRDSLTGKISEVDGIGSPTLVITEVRGGEGALSVPDEVTLVVDRRLLPEEDASAVERELTNIIGRAVVAAPGVKCKVRRRRLLPAVVADERLSPLLDCLRREGERVVGAPLALYGAAFETPARDFAAAGVPVVMFGAGSIVAGGHMAARADEHLDLDDLRIATEVLANVMARLLHRPEAQSPGPGQPASVEP